ncbi:MAG: serine/threonine-protein kinase [Gemmataceae bacterium]
MSCPSSLEELLALVRKSGMVDEQKLNAYLNQREMGRGLPADPRDAADSLVNDGLITNFQAEQYLLGKWRGFTLGKYKLLERVGVGGMGQVFLCEHMFMKKHVAVKVLPPAKADQPAALGRFYREARAAGSISHPNIVRTHDIDQEGNLHFIVMDYVDGANLLDIVKKHGKLDMGRVVSYIRQVALGLDYAYRNGIIHRDIKPGNILIDRRGKAQILDMGLARFFNDQNDNLTIKYDDKIVLGTADYVAPEQVANSHSVDTRADIYALGATAYFLLAGHPPFPSGTVSQKLLWHRTKDPTPIRQIRPEVPEGLANAIARMMSKDPKNRYQVPGDVAVEMEKWLPEQVPLPAKVEMPVLSPAATFVSEEQFAEETEPMAMQSTPASGLLVGATSGRSDDLFANVASPNNSSVVDLRTAPPARQAPGPFGGATRNSPKPFNSSIPKDPWESPEEDFNFGKGSKNPFAANAGTPFPPLSEQTPVAGKLNSGTIRATTIFAPTPKFEDQRDFRNQVVMYVILGSTTLIAFCVVAWKFFLK